MTLAPFQVDFDITMKCMYRCKHCNVAAGETLKDEMTTQQIKDVLDQLDEAGVSDVSITGGEPLTRQDCLEILAYAANKKGFYLTLNTNGLMMTEEIIRFLEMNCPKINIAVSLDGFDPKSYSVLRRIFVDQERVLDNEFNVVTHNLKLLVNSRLNVGVNYTITHATIDNIWRTYDFIQELGIKKMLGIKFFPYGYGRDNKKELELQYEEWKKFLSEAMERKKRDSYYKGLQISVTCPWEMYLPLLEKGYKKEDVTAIFDYSSPLESELYSRIRNVGCHAGVTSCAISPNGDLYPCGTISSKFPPFICGNLKKQKLLDIWENSEVLKSLRSLDISQIDGACKECDYIDLCGGGCRARAYTSSGVLTSADYLCPLNIMKEEKKNG